MKSRKFAYDCVFVLRFIQNEEAASLSLRTMVTVFTAWFNFKELYVACNFYNKQ
jgi:hypothetical protein